MAASSFMMANDVAEAQASGLTRWFAAGANAALVLNATEANVQPVCRVAGTLANQWVRCTAYTLASAATINSRIASATGNQQIPVNGTGSFTDTTNTDAVSAGQTINGVINTVGIGSGSVSLIAAGYTFAANTNTSQLCTAQGPQSFSTASTTRCWNIAGMVSLVTTGNEAQAQAKVYTANATLTNFGVYITAFRATNTTFGIRKNGVADSLTVTVNNTGVFEDTNQAHNDTLAANDLISAYFTTGTGADTLTFENSWVEIKTTDSTSYLISAFPGTGTTQAQGTTRYFHPAGECKPVNSTTNCRGVVRVAGTISNYRVHCGAFSLGGVQVATCTVRKNGVDGALTVTVNGTGEFEDTNAAHNYTITSTDDLDYECVTDAGSGTVAFNVMQVMLTPPAAAASTPVVPWHLFLARAA